MEDETESEEEQGDRSFGPLTQRARSEGRPAPRQSMQRTRSELLKLAPELSPGASMIRGGRGRDTEASGDQAVHPPERAISVSLSPASGQKRRRKKPPPPATPSPRALVASMATDSTPSLQIVASPGVALRLSQLECEVKVLNAALAGEKDGVKDSLRELADLHEQEATLYESESLAEAHSHSPQCRALALNLTDLDVSIQQTKAGMQELLGVLAEAVGAQLETAELQLEPEPEPEPEAEPPYGNRAQTPEQMHTASSPDTGDEASEVVQTPGVEHYVKAVAAYSPSPGHAGLVFERGEIIAVTSPASATGWCLGFLMRDPAHASLPFPNSYTTRVELRRSTSPGRTRVQAVKGLNNEQSSTWH
jgi:hypothetical protein